jgi:tRNA (cytosine38-C5)-methyltransferase
LRVIEFFSGIGGWRSALERAHIAHQVLAAYELDEAAVDVYMHNFRHPLTVRRNIMGLDVAELNAHNADMWVMSPPCQPHTRQGRRRDVADTRSLPLATLVRLLLEYVCSACTHSCMCVHRIIQPPRFVLLENVVGFETSLACQSLIDALCVRHFSVEVC